MTQESNGMNGLSESDSVNPLIHENKEEGYYSNLDFLSDMIYKYQDLTPQDNFDQRRQEIKEDHEMSMKEKEFMLRKKKLDGVLDTWKVMQQSEFVLRTRVATFLLSITGVLALGGVALFALYSTGVISIASDSKWIAAMFFGTIFTTIAAMTHTLVKGLFPQKKEDTLSEINNIVKDL